jgi:5-methylcytosine-specific restriction endonuclease McrA
MDDRHKRNFCIAALRRGSLKWKPRYTAQAKYKVQIGNFSTGRPKYGWFCEVCGVIEKKKDCQMDHRIPVIGPEGFTTLDEYADRLFCDESNLSNLCKPCHKEKSKIETAERKAYRDNLKEKV